MSRKTVMGKSQLELIAKHLEERKSISALEAATSYKVRSLSKRICELENNGWVIARERCADGSGQEYVRYHLVPTPRRHW